jgi:hypothetical protein
MKSPSSTGRGFTPHALLHVVLLAVAALAPVLVGWRAAIALDSGLLGLVAGAMTVLFGVAMLGGTRSPRGTA